MTKPDANTDPGAGLAVPSDSAIAELDDYARSLPVDDPELIRERIIRNIMTATTVEQIANAGTVTKAEDLLNMPMSVLDLRVSDSTIAEGPEIFLHVDAQVLATGEPVTFATSASDVMVKLLMFHKRQFLPVDVVLYRSDRPTKAGFFPVFLRLARPDEKPEEPF